MEFAPRTYRVVDRDSSRAISIETVKSICPRSSRRRGDFEAKITLIVLISPLLYTI